MKISTNRIAIIQHETITTAGISPADCVQWVTDSFMMKSRAQLPPKISLHPQGDDFFNTMPALLPADEGRFAVKVVHRIAGQEPSLGSDILLYDSATGQLLAIVDGDWITTMRTGAVATLTIKLLQRSGVDTYSFYGLGNTARATALCLLASLGGKPVTMRLMRYKDQAEQFVDRFKDYQNVNWEIVDDVHELVAGADVLVSSITSASGLVCDDDSAYRKGILLIPIHTRGFQNCDLFFDKVYGDDRGHVQGFRYFDKFRHFDELANVLTGVGVGRESDDERILCYNIGLGLHDALFASRIYDIVGAQCNETIVQRKPADKFWI